ncbi:hypothetical protein B0H11DRAFT_2113522, partial [Mycena galericulata]
MFPPFENASQFYPGLIVWCDPNSYDMEISTLAQNTTFDHKKARDLRPCLVVAVNQINESIQVARLCATTPMDTRRWVRVDSIPPITWKLNDAWLWVGTPPTVAMVFNNGKVMHPHKDMYYSTPPVAAANLQNYWVHRQNYLNRGPGPSGYPTSRPPRHQTTSMRSTMPYFTPPGSTIYSSNPSPVQSLSAEAPGGMFGQAGPASASHHGSSSTAYPTPAAYPPMAYYGHNSQQNPPSGFNTLSTQPVVVPTGFTETHPARPGWWRNPETGWFWHAGHGLLPPQ